MRRHWAHPLTNIAVVFTSASTVHRMHSFPPPPLPLLPPLLPPLLSLLLLLLLLPGH
jgi:hypothetical protein